MFTPFSPLRKNSIITRKGPTASSFRPDSNPVLYSLEDRFTTDRAAGAVNGTAAEPTGGNRVTVDPSSKLSISGGKAVFAANAATNPGLYYAAQTRQAGKILVFRFRRSAQGFDILGWNTNQATTSQNVLYLFQLTLRISISAISVGDYSLDTDYDVAVILRAAGAFYFIKGGLFTKWTLIYFEVAGTTSTLFPAFWSNNTGADYTLDNVRIPSNVQYIPRPLASDSFNRSNGAIGEADGNGSEENTLPTTWDGSVATVVSNKGVITPATLGAELLTNGDFEGAFSSGLATGWTKVGNTPTEESVQIHGGLKSQKYVGGASGNGIFQYKGLIDRWHKSDVWVYVEAGTVDITGGNGASQQQVYSKSTATWEKFEATFRPAGTDSNGWYVRQQGASSATFYVDDASIKEMTLTELFSSISLSTPNIFLTADVVCAVGFQAGLVLNLDSISNPQNFILVYIDRGAFVYVDECVNGVYTNKMKTSVSYSAGAKLKVSKNGTKLRVYYNEVFRGTEQTMTANTNTRHGIFSTSGGNNFDNFSVWPLGIENQHDILDTV